MSSPCHGGASENGEDRASRAAGATYILSCDADRQATRGREGRRVRTAGSERAAQRGARTYCHAKQSDKRQGGRATRENGGERASCAAGATYILSCEAEPQATRGREGPRVRTAGSERAAQRGPRTDELPLKLQLVQVRVPPSFQMAPPYHGGARENGGERASRAAGPRTYCHAKQSHKRQGGERGDA
jgi:hypothetical protein